MKRMLNRAALSAVTLLMMITIACIGVKTIIASWDYAPTVIADFNTSQENKDRLSQGSKKSGAAWRVYDEADKSTPELKKAARNVLIGDQSQIIAKYFAHTGDANIDKWLDKIVGFARIFLGLPAGPSMPSANEMRSITNSNAEIEPSKKDIQEFEQHIKRGPDK